jgi:hypothetical protein
MRENLKRSKLCPGRKPKNLFSFNKLHLMFSVNNYYRHKEIHAIGALTIYILNCMWKMISMEHGTAVLLPT